MVEWWSSQGIVGQFFFVVAFVSTMIFIIQLVANLIGLGLHDVDVDTGGIDHDVDVPAEVDVDHPDMEVHSTGLGMLSVRTVLAFMVGFGWTGTVAHGYGLNVPISVAASTLVGFLFMCMVFWLMKAIYGLSDSGNVEERNAKGNVGTVYVPIPASGQGKGQIQVVVQGRMREYPAMTGGSEVIPTGKPVRVTEVLDGGTMMVEAIEKGVDKNAD